ncbi:hypothetical protein LMG28727_06076 [Paraburkholderia kirstenboschensis]|uniref:replication initiation protein n=1 Tax=Paraburkholderia kirstenboschensis TaxID=1245436 RepID=UPI000A779FB8|nr:replication initiation protein [Paraburkholderia kirstenboschensis]CAD6556371.1 hypothetical protein LMG28727_06076 [Paraburkholderia kirstenboschensis]
MARSKSAENQVSLFNSVEPPDLLRKAVQAIHIAPRSGKIGLQQRKMFSSLIKNAIKQESVEPGRSSFTITIGALSQDSGLNSNNTQYVKDTVNSLISTVVNWDYLASDSSTVWRASGLLAGAELKQAVLRYSFSEQIRGELLNPEVFALIDMRIAREFRRSHSLALWENTVRYEGVGLTARIPLGKFRDLILGQDKSAQTYQEYKLFKSKVLLPCIREVNELSDHTLELVEHKVGRKVEAVQFRVTRKPSVTLGPDADGRNEGLIEEMTKLGLPRSEAKKLLSQYGDQRVRAAVVYTNGRVTKRGASPIDNIPAYFRKALINEYAPIADSGEDKSPKPVGKAEQQAQLRAKYDAWKLGEARAYFLELEINDQSQLIARYNDSVGASNLKLSTSKKPSKLAETSFFTWLALDTWGEPTADELLEFLLSKAS